MDCPDLVLDGTVMMLLQPITRLVCIEPFLAVQHQCVLDKSCSNCYAAHLLITVNPDGQTP